MASRSAGVNSKLEGGKRSIAGTVEPIKAIRFVVVGRAVFIVVSKQAC